MNLSEYQQLAKRTLGDACLTNLRMGVIGETGEIVDYIKKVKFHGHELNKEKLIEELGDLMWYVASIATLKRFSLEKCEQQIPLITKIIAEEVDSGNVAIEFVTFSLYSGTSNLASEPPMGLRASDLAFYSVLECIQWLAYFADATLSDVMKYNIAKLKKRYPNGFEPKRSINRG